MRRSFAWSVGSATTSCFNLRLRERDLEVKMWREKAWPRTTLPVPVFLNRLDAPLCVFSFGIQIFLDLDYGNALTSLV